jgi:hypothetical protein
LYKAAVPANRALTKADFDEIEADFTGYTASSAVVWGTIFDDASGNARTVGAVKQFDCTDDANPQDIYGYYLVSGGALQGWEAFDTPQPARAAFDAIVVIPHFEYGQ